MCYIARWNIEDAKGFFHELQTNAVVLLQISNRKNGALIHRLTPFSRLLRHAGDTVDVFSPPSTGGKYIATKGFIIVYWTRTTTIADRTICF